MAKVVMYSTAVCPYCQRAEMLLKSKGVTEIEKIRIDGSGATRPHDAEDRPSHRAPDFYWRSSCGWF